MFKRLIRSAAIPMMAFLLPVSIWAATDLTQEEATAFVKGKSVQAKHMDHYGPFGLDFRANGTLYGTVEGRSDAGSWEVKEAKLCIKWRKWIYDGCGALQRTDDKQVQHLWPDGRVHFVAPAD